MVCLVHWLFSLLRKLRPALGDANAERALHPPEQACATLRRAPPPPCADNPLLKAHFVGVISATCGPTFYLGQALGVCLLSVWHGVLVGNGVCMRCCTFGLSGGVWTADAAPKTALSGTMWIIVWCLNSPDQQERVLFPQLWCSCRCLCRRGGAGGGAEAVSSGWQLIVCHASPTAFNRSPTAVGG